MKNLFRVVLLILFLPGICHGAGYVMGTYGIGDRMDGPSIGVEIGGIFLSDLHPDGGAFSFGVGISLGDSDDDPPGSYPLVPGADILYSEEYNDGDEQEIYISIGAELVPSLFLVGGTGYTSQDVVTLGISSGTIYRIDSETEHHTPLMLGIRYAIEGFTVGVGFDSRRGILAGIGIAF